MPSLKIIIAAMILLPTIVFAQSQTVTSCADKLVGCITCSTDFFLAV